MRYKRLIIVNSSFFLDSEKQKVKKTSANIRQTINKHIIHERGWVMVVMFMSFSVQFSMISK